MTRLAEKPALPRCQSCDDEDCLSKYCDVCFAQLYELEDNYQQLKQLRDSEVRAKKTAYELLVAKWNAQVEADRQRETRRQNEKQRKQEERALREREAATRRQQERTDTLQAMERAYQAQREAKLRAEIAAKQAKMQQKVAEQREKDKQLVALLYSRFGASLFSYLSLCAKTSITDRELSTLTVKELRTLLEKVIKTGVKA